MNDLVPTNLAVALTAIDGITNVRKWSNETMHGISLTLRNDRTFSIIFGFGSNTNNKWLQTESWDDAFAQARTFECWAWQNGKTSHWDDVASNCSPERVVCLLAHELAQG